MKLYIITIIVISIFMFSCSNSSNPANKETQDINQAKNQQAIMDMASKYNAITNWEQEGYFTFQLQENLLENNNRPILFSGYIVDIVKKGNKYVVQFESLNLAAYSLRTIHFMLECDKQAIAKILAHEKELFAEFAVIVNINSIEKPTFIVKGGYPEDLESEGTIDISTDTPLIIKGQCIDLLYASGFSLGK